MTTKNGLLPLEAHRGLAQSSNSRYLRHGRLVLGTLLLAAGLVMLIQTKYLDNISTLNVADGEVFFEGLDKCRESRSGDQGQQWTKDRKNPRWNPISGQQRPVLIQNATLFDGQSVLAEAVDILFEAGVVSSVSPTALNRQAPNDIQSIDAHGRFVTPGLVDMHSHHLLSPFPRLLSTSDVNERPVLGPITPFLRSIDGFKPYDPLIRIIASGGVTSSLILPGSANIIGGEAYLVKNLPTPGPNAEPVVEELLLDDGVPEKSRKRYLKVACGENPKGIYKNTRLGLAWLLRKHLKEGQDLQERQSSWCRKAAGIEKTGFSQSRQISQFLKDEGKRPESFELETSLALLRGELNVNVHCYEPEDFDRMLSVLHEFDIHPRAFHHALEAWQLPEWLKTQEENITIATFAEHGLYKAEAYGANLRGPKILDDHGVRVALKSDHNSEEFYAKYLAYQAAISHSFGLSEEKSLQAITSVPARSIQQDHRIGYVRPGYDADLVIWDDHPLQVGATPVQVFIDGRPLLENATLSNHEDLEASNPQAPNIRPSLAAGQKKDTCAKVQPADSRIVFTGIQKALIDTNSTSFSAKKDLVMLVENGQIKCLDEKSSCFQDRTQEDFTHIALENGHVLPGLVAFGTTLGIQSLSSESSTGDGSGSKSEDALNENRLRFAKYGIHLQDRALARARIGGVTRAVTAPLQGSGINQGVSVGLRTGASATILENGIWKDDVALHLVIGQFARDDETPSVSSGIERLRQLLQTGQDATSGTLGIYAQAANGSIPVVVQVFNEDDIAQLVLVKRQFQSVNLIIHGGHGAPLVANPLAEAGIPVILTGNRGAPDNWEKKNALVGPPLTESAAKILLDAGVLLGLGLSMDSKIHGLAQEAWWAGKYAGLTEQQAIALVSTNIDLILNSQSEKTDAGALVGDFVVWEGNPLRGEGSVVASFQGDGKVSDCWPDIIDIAV
ncbi:hypothetical protein MYU51_006939 [Penicillium brevicompactum]|uniref:uncharacterized protein n=1 Tax=Penicillium brevicompactum TaxID=5074 RepID=UPI002540E0CA|nr:uncharacterized protein N7506_002000 [Penicillium brevicompactum]KAJ5348747.1 hypothetical protein N7506_002000 [Penicillium brevicompactum]